MKLPELVYLLAYTQDGRGSYSDGYDRGYKDGQDHPINEQIRDMVSLDIMKNIVAAI
jgi:hypothetical protein